MSKDIPGTWRVIEFPNPPRVNPPAAVFSPPPSEAAAPSRPASVPETSSRRRPPLKNGGTLKTS
ncbi:MAG: hypothetical protein ACKO6N_11405 [Myxococcota bacterium]